MPNKDDKNTSEATFVKMVMDEVGADIETKGFVAVTPETATISPFSSKGGLANALDELCEAEDNASKEDEGGDVKGLSVNTDPIILEPSLEKGYVHTDSHDQRNDVEGDIKGIDMPKSAEDSVKESLSSALDALALDEEEVEIDEEMVSEVEAERAKKDVPSLPAAMGGGDEPDENGLVYITRVFTVDPNKYISNNYRPLQLPMKNAAKVGSKPSYVSMSNKEALDEGMEMDALTASDDGVEAICFDELQGYDYSNVVLDAGVKQAPSKKTCKTTFAQCKAENPLYCRFHGPKLLEKDLKTNISAAIGSSCVVSVTKDKGQKSPLTFRLTIGCPPAMKQKVEDWLHKFFTSTPGLSCAEEYKNVGGGKMTTEFDMDIEKADTPPKKKDAEALHAQWETEKATKSNKVMPVVGETPAKIEKVAAQGGIAPEEPSSTNKPLKDDSKSLEGNNKPFEDNKEVGVEKVEESKTDSPKEVVKEEKGATSSEPKEGKYSQDIQNMEEALSLWTQDNYEMIASNEEISPLYYAATASLENCKNHAKGVEEIKAKLKPLETLEGLTSNQILSKKALQKALELAEEEYDKSKSRTRMAIEKFKSAITKTNRETAEYIKGVYADKVAQIVQYTALQIFPNGKPDGVSSVADMVDELYSQMDEVANDTIANMGNESDAQEMAEKYSKLKDMLAIEQKKDEAIEAGEQFAKTMNTFKDKMNKWPTKHLFSDAVSNLGSAPFAFHNPKKLSRQLNEAVNGISTKAQALKDTYSKYQNKIETIKNELKSAAAILKSKNKMAQEAEDFAELIDKPYTLGYKIPPLVQEGLDKNGKFGKFHWHVKGDKTVVVEMSNKEVDRYGAPKLVTMEEVEKLKDDLNEVFGKYGLKVEYNGGKKVADQVAHFGKAAFVVEVASKKLDIDENEMGDKEDWSSLSTNILKLSKKVDPIVNHIVMGFKPFLLNPGWAPGVDGPIMSIENNGCTMSDIIKLSSSINGALKEHNLKTSYLTHSDDQVDFLIQPLAPQSIQEEKAGKSKEAKLAEAMKKIKAISEKEKVEKAIPILEKKLKGDPSNEQWQTLLKKAKAYLAKYQEEEEYLD